MLVGRFTGAALAFALATYAAAVAEPYSQERWQALRNFIADMDVQLDIERDIYRSELERGVKDGLWTVEEQTIADRSAQSFFFADDPPSGPGKLPAVGGGKWRLRATRLQSSQLANMSELDGWLRQRVAALTSVRSRAKRTLFALVDAEVERVWLEAKSALDLQPAIALLAETKKVDAERWDHVTQLLATTPGGGNSVGAETDLLELIYFWTVVTSPEPLILPDPNGDIRPAMNARQQWQALIRARYRFGLRPAMMERFAEFERAFQKRQTAARNRLDQLIIENAPAAAYEAALKEDESLSDSPKDSKRRLPPAPRLPTEGPDHRRIIEQNASFMQGSRPQTAGRPEFYAHWLAFRQAEERGEMHALARSRDALLRATNAVPIQLATIVRERATRTAQEKSTERADATLPEVSAMAQKDPVQRMAAALQAGNGRPGYHFLRAKLADAWRDIRGDEVLAEDYRAGAASVWESLVGSHHAKVWLELRESATRAALASLVNRDIAALDSFPLITVVRNEFERAVTAGEIETARKILNLAILSAALGQEESNEKAGLFQRLDQARMAEMRADFPTARAVYSEMVWQSRDLALSRIAGERLKGLPAKEPAPR
jgi:hypothetical protein